MISTMALSDFLLSGWRIIKAWFAVAETLVVNALPKESLRMVLELITDPSEDMPYTETKERILLLTS